MSGLLEKRPYMPNVPHLALFRLQTVAIFLSGLSLALTAAAMTGYSATRGVAPREDIVMLSASAASFVYITLAMLVSPPVTADDTADVEDAQKARSKRRRPLIVNAVLSGLLSIFLLAAVIFAAIRVSKNRGSCSLYFNRSVGQFWHFNRKACRLTTASSVFVAIDFALFVAQSALSAQAARNVL